MTTFTHRLTKRDGNWVAESVTKLEHNRELSIRTRRDSNGTVRTYATVSKIEGSFRTHRMGFGSKGGDFQKTVLSLNPTRATSKAIQTQHDTAMAQMESILFQVRKHYEEEDREANAAQPTAETSDAVATDTAAVAAASSSEVAA
ncbi:hypothetical protein [Pseudorhodoferax soli]|uniref:Uncharacterized protein n=1 Tax=Pseudorhodoferax soli TaxID=545864 RepID=A0A368XE30_9BURK|nr:hypothetical protein [Pseudorhodoferax soli]RCW66231.1 hypothetical protein DES41_111189 [Pseudorhodoferax soli]